MHPGICAAWSITRSITALINQAVKMAQTRTLAT